MNPKKSKEKERRRARKLADEAWEAADGQNLDLAEKIIRRAVTTQPDNPVLWNDQGVILLMRSKTSEAEESFRAALSLAPTYAEALGHLADLRARQGYLRDAVRLLEQTVRCAEQPARFAERLSAYRTLADSQEERSASAPIKEDVAPVRPSPLAPAIAALNWREIGDELTKEGCVLISALVAPATCAELCGTFDDDARFAKTVVMERDDFGQGTYRYFRAPIPEFVDGLRRAIYPHVAAIANEWQRLLGEAELFPASWEEFRLQCQHAGQSTPTPILLKYAPGGFNALHRDLRGSVYFPIQMAVVLSPLATDAHEGFRGGSFLFCDVPEGKKARRREVVAGLGDTVLFCTRDRLVQVGGAYGLQPVKHGVSTITAGPRFVLGVPFHEYR